MAAPKKQRRTCPVCNFEMNQATEERDMYFCPECSTHTKKGEIFNPSYDGDLDKVGYVKKLRVVEEGEKPEPDPDPKTFDFFFDSKDKKRFEKITDLSTQDGWMILTREDGREVLINSDKVNFIEEV